VLLIEKYLYGIEKMFFFHLAAKLVQKALKYFVSYGKYSWQYE